MPELKENGFFPTSAPTLVTPEPPKKKQRVGHHGSNPRHRHAPHHRPDGHTHGRTHIFFNSDHEYRGSHKNRYDGPGGAKAWKPKRPVPTSRKVPPVKLLLDEGGDLPRGGFKGETVEMKKRKKMKTKKLNRGSSAPPDGGAKRVSPGWRDRTPNPDSKQEKKRRKKFQKLKMAEKKLDSLMYPTDENLFTIKQRRGRRR